MLRSARNSLAALAALVAVLAGAGPASAACSSVTDQLTASKAAVEVTCEPSGTTQIGVAYMQDLNATGVKYTTIPATQKTYTPPAGYPVVDLQAKSATAAIGNWAGRKTTVPGGEVSPKAKLEQELVAATAKEAKLATELAAAKVTVAELTAKLAEVTAGEGSAQAEKEAREKAEREAAEKAQREKEEREKLEEPIHEEIPGGSVLTGGLNVGGWGSVEKSELPPMKLGVVRIDAGSSPPATSTWESMGYKVIADFHGPYSTSGVSGLNHSEYVNRVVSYVKSNPHVLAIEVLNEPGGSWFWGSNAESTANRESYAKLLIEVHNALVSNFGTARPKILASFDGGHLNSNAWGKGWSTNKTALADVDGLTNHPYGGTGTRSTAILGNRKGVEETHSLTSKPVWITEVGFPTKGPTGDSLQYTEGEEAKAIYEFAGWARVKGYIPAVTFYSYRDSEEGGGYGVITHGGFKKKAYNALKQFNEGVTCTTCS